MPLRLCALACALVASACSSFDESLLRVPASKPGPIDAGRTPKPPDAAIVDAASEGGILVQCSSSNGTCSRPNAVTACSQGACLLVECEAPFVDCDGDADNGCEATLDSLENCGLCGATCALPNATAACQQGECVFEACGAGFGDCDQIPGNGCEVSLNTLTDCGGCATTCAALNNASPGCNALSCGVGVCLGLYGDCDTETDNGCEQPLRSAVHCGACDTPCDPANALGDCAGGSCAITGCLAANVDCNGLAGDGCEATLDDAANCGVCGAACDLQQAIRVACTGAPLGCVVNHSCTAFGCTDGAPENGCATGFGDCNGLGNDGCETPLDTLSDCGACGRGCAIPNAISACDEAACVVTACEPGFAACSSSACSSLASDASHCGACNTVCGGAAPNCAGGKCTSQVCAPGTADCNGVGTDACEVSLTVPSQCGACGLSCGPYPHATAACTSLRCTLGSCDAGFRDCDGALSNGCEVDIRTLSTCGACGQTCSLPFADESCASGTCTLVTCDPDRANCDANVANGCETSTELPATCGTCNNDCRGRPNVLSAGCDQGECAFVCAPGYADCDGKVANGCEASLANYLNCGTCGNDCGALPQVSSASCSGGEVCGDLVCDPGYGDCDGNPSNGCERAVDTLSSCGACDRPCAPAHAAGICSAVGACGIGTCDSGYADCNGLAADGCEASLNDAATCGTCQNKCPGALECANGACICTADAQCGNPSFDCCGGVCKNTNSVCSLWPCPVAATRRPQQNCGACGTTCGLFCCGALGE